MNGVETSTVLMVALTVLLGVRGGAIGGRWGMIIAFVMAFGMNFVSYWFSDKIVLAMYRAPVTEAEARELYATVRRLARKADMPMPKVYIMDEDTAERVRDRGIPSIAVVAAGPGHPADALTGRAGGRIAHELAHIKHRDILWHGRGDNRGRDQHDRADGAVGRALRRAAG